jgi:hypothetical protein
MNLSPNLSSLHDVIAEANHLRFIMTKTNQINDPFMFGIFLSLYDKRELLLSHIGSVVVSCVVRAR